MGLVDVVRNVLGDRQTDVYKMRRRMKQHELARLRKAERELPNNCPDCGAKVSHFKDGPGVRGYKCECSMWCVCPLETERKGLEEIYD